MTTTQDEHLFAEARRQSIVKLINHKQRVSVAELCAEYSVSPTTIRCDLNDLEKMGALKRTYGGAVCNKKTTLEYTLEQETKLSNEKIAIAHAARKYIQDGDSIALDTGTIPFEIAKLLSDIKNLTVFTNDLSIALFLENTPAINVIVAGGSVRKGFHCTHGTFTTEMMNSLNIDKAFITADAICVHRSDISTPSFEIANIRKEMCKMSDEVILLADNSKFRKRSLVKFAEFSDIDLLITDDKVEDVLIKQIKASGIGVEIVDSNAY